MLMPLIPLKDILVFPKILTPIIIGRMFSIQALEYAKKANKNKMKVVFVVQKTKTDYPKKKDIYTIGTIAKIVQFVRISETKAKILVEGTDLCAIRECVESDNHLFAKVDIIRRKDQVNGGNNEKIDALKRTIVEEFETYIQLENRLPTEFIDKLELLQQNNHVFIDHIINLLVMSPTKEKQAALEVVDDVYKRMQCVGKLLQKEVSVLKIQLDLKENVKKNINKNQREFLLHEQMRIIQQELEKSQGGSEFTALKKRIEQSDMPLEIKQKAMKECKKLNVMPSMSSESALNRNYLEILLDLPWEKKTSLNYNLKEARKILDEAHYSLEDIKERVIEYLAVHKQSNKLPSAILCLVGPPGVGKTTLGMSIAQSMNRKFVKIAVGGIEHESEFRGHRRTYIGAMPGRIIQALIQSGVKNPLVMLDEIDKINTSFRGNPASALLEILDMAQNQHFVDHYIDIPFDLSQVLFITTANSLDISPPLLDRLEIVRIAGYSEEEKNYIGQKHIIPKQMEIHGLKTEDLSINVSALRQIIQDYTREAGVRNLERYIAKICRKTVMKIMEKPQKINITPQKIKSFLGNPLYPQSALPKEPRVGAVNALAFTGMGGDVFVIEASVIPGKGKVLSTGSLGPVMKESVQAALTVIRRNSQYFTINHDFYTQYDFHIHTEQAAVEKEGPSAGAAICLVIASSLTKIPIPTDIAMTGEITLHGKILPIGGLKEKLMAAKRYGVHTVWIPKENEISLNDVPKHIKKELEIKTMANIEELFSHVLRKEES